MLASMVFTVVTCAAAQNPVEFPWLCGGACGSHMVLQRAPLQARIWGVAGAVPAGSRVSASLDGGEELKTVAGSDGSWELQLAQQPPSTGHVVHVKAGSLAATLKDVAFGDVYLCGGQSNMEFSMRGAANGSVAVADSMNYPGLRLFTVGWNQSSVPLANVTSKANYTWGVSSPETVLGLQQRGKDAWFSAVCYYFGREIYRELGGKVPIGLIASNWGGTCIEAWSSPDSLASCRNFSSGVGVDDAVEDHADLGGPTHNSVLYNAMIAPLLKMRLAGEAWYQGENNAKNPSKYACTFPAMIQDYREKFELPDFSFFYVELAASGSIHFPEARRAQRHALALDNVGFATAIDQGWRGLPVHSPRKEEVGRRLALSALGIRYNMSVVYEGPTLESVDLTAAGSRVAAKVTFRSASNLHAAGTADCEFNGNKTCCSESPFVFVYGTNQVRANYTLSSSGDKGAALLTTDLGVPVTNQSALYVEFEFEGAPECALYNGVGGPDDHTGIAAPPFSTSPEFGPAVRQSVASMTIV